MRVKKGLVIQKMGDTYVAYDNETSTLHEFNEIGFLILSGLEKRKDRKKIVQEIINQFKISSEEAQKDLDQFLKLLRKKDLIVDKK